MSLDNLEEGLQSRYNTTYTVNFPEFPRFMQQPSQVILHQEERSHDIMLLRYIRPNEFFHKSLKTGTPVEVTWKNNTKAKGSFYGYVMSVKRTRAAQLDPEIEIRCIATSLPLKDVVSNVWTNKTAPEVVKEIAKKTGLKAVVSPHKARFSQLSQYGSSYWEFLQELAFKIGYVCWVENSTIYFMDIDEVLDKNFGSIPLLQFKDEFVPPFYHWIERTLDKFEPMIGDLIEDNDKPVRAVKHITGVDPIKPKSYNSVDKPKSKVKKEEAQTIFQDNSSFDVANSKLFADSLTKAKSERARFSMPGKFYAQGDPRIKPYALVEISGVDSTTDGYWMVSSVTHTFSRDGVYHSDGVVYTDGRGANVKSQQRSTTKRPYLNLTNYGNGPIAKPKKPALSTSNYMYNQKTSGYTLTSQKWRA